MDFWGKRPMKLVAIFDVSSSSVGGALVSFTEGRKPEILQEIREEMPTRKKSDPERYFSMMLATFEHVAERTRGTKGKEIADEVVCFFSDPWYESDIRNGTYERAKSFTADEDLLEDVIGEMVVDFENRQSSEAQLIEKEAMEVRLNGYEVEHFSGRTARSFEVDYFASAVPKVVIDAMSETLHERFPERSVYFRTLPFSSYVVARDFFCQEDASFVFANISGEMTNVQWVRNGVLEQNVAIAFGRNSLLRKLSEDMDVSFEQARSLFELSLKGQLEVQTEERVEKTLDDFREKYVRAFNDVVRNFSRSGIAPERIFFTAEVKSAEWFGRILRNDVVFTRNRTRDLPPKTRHVTYVSRDLIKQFVRFSAGAKGDVALGTEALFLFHSQDDTFMA